MSNDELREELEQLQMQCKGEFVDPKIFRRIEDIQNVLLTGQSNVKIKVAKGRNPQRVTSFTRDRR